MFIGLRNNFRRDEEVEMALDVCTHGGAKVMGLTDYGLAPGCAADLVLVDGESLTEAVVSHAPRAAGGQARPHRGARRQSPDGARRDAATDGPVLLTARWVVGHEAGRHRLLRDGEVVFETRPHRLRRLRLSRDRSRAASTTAMR